jgi:predicted HAD superfamily Cof-like phosphohydrolase
MTSNPITDVHRFMAAAGQTTMEDNKEQAILYRKLILEEYKELMLAFEQNDDVEILDALFDLPWVCFGYAYSRGWDMPAAWIEGAKSNLAKIDPVTGKVLKRPDGKVQKPTDWQPPNFKQFVK